MQTTEQSTATTALVRDFGDEGDLVAAQQLDDVVASLHKPRRIVRMVKAGAPTVGMGISGGVPVPGFSSAPAYDDTVRAGRLPAALVQEPRENVGAHSDRCTDRDGTFHTRWSDDGSEIEAGPQQPRAREQGA